MINKLAKMLVLVQTVFSLAALTYALFVFLEAKDLGQREPVKDVLEYNADGTPKASVRHASVYDKSVAAHTIAVEMRDRTYKQVKPALDELRKTEPFLPENHLSYTADLERLKKATDKIEVKRLKDGGVTLNKAFGTPLLEDEALANITKSRAEYEKDLAKLFKEVTDLDDEIRKIVNKTKHFTKQLTGTNDDNEYIQPGLYKLVDLEYKAQQQLKAEIEEIKPLRSKAIEKADFYRFRHDELRSTLEILRRTTPAAPKDAKKA